MQVRTNIAKTVEEVDTKARYDAAVKKVLSDPQILAWILKYTITEFQGYAVSDIMACIEGEPEVSTHLVHPGYYTKAVEGMSTEDAELNAQKVTYDIRFGVKVPGQGSVGMIVNVEAQNKFYESYDLVTRGVFYCARMLSTQVRNEESAEEYNHLQKVYSIWICMQAPLNSEYTITGYRMHRLLTMVLSSELTSEEKIEAMKNDYDIITTVELEGGLAKMCNLSDYIWEKATEHGMQQGIEQGIQQGIQQGAVKVLISLVQDGLLSVEIAAQRAKVTIEEMKSMCQLT